MKNALFLPLAVCATLAVGQSVTPVLLGAGTGNGASNAARIFWSVGELSVSTLTAPANQITQGFWQPNLAKFTSTNAPLQAEYGIACWPNPVSDALHITFNLEKPLRLTLFSLDGRLLLQESAITSGHSLSLSSLPSSVYLLRFDTDDGAWILTQKVVKQ